MTRRLDATHRPLQVHTGLPRPGSPVMIRRDRERSMPFSRTRSGDHPLLLRLDALEKRIGNRLLFGDGNAVIRAGDRIGIQCAQLGPQALPTISNGLILQLDTAGIDDQCATVFFLSGSTQAAWLPDKGLMPVLGLDL